ncbi:hypothetical protein A3B87_02020 [Candidatus Kuenenbacteria bacterium RIFCSPHIGHO2_02_FULL_39_13]|uniref:Uncharacterized protein n=1 Tax=Candidatus Kuenenbacteria bacterium RIFCSPHIGHO2_02_FULL_39_13 TaxID=1798561 RepID=A0A1F6FL37_9BACT|nr:MAG: hypothetical protein A3B87_02020 [Candidatus Kuenenbacteria bacterium RIFCSPHIGHO2_02_FULL_39_13]
MSVKIRTNLKQAKIKDNPFEIAIQLTPDQVGQIYKQLLRVKKIGLLKNKDWIEEPEILDLIEKEARKGRGEYERGAVISLAELESIV